MIGSAPIVQTYVLSKESINQILVWIQNCKLGHPDCNNGSDDGLPTRLLSLSWSEHGPKVRLEEVEQTRNYNYIALSHVWALTSPTRTILFNQSHHHDDIPFSSLSKTLQDAVVLTLHLGISYLWIDSLCIVQDSSVDWEMECPRMASIYRNAFTVFAAHGSDLGFGKVHTTEIRDPDQCSDNENPIYARLVFDHIAISNQSVTSSRPWFTRGWCLQERLFASRILHFGGPLDELSFECNTNIRCECNALTPDEGGQEFTNTKCTLAHTLKDVERNPNDRESLEKLSDIYFWICANLSFMKFTYQTDIFPAISSLNAQLAPYLGKYYAGLWERHFIAGLQWQSLAERRSSRQKSYIAPSFSWASVSEPICWRPMEDIQKMQTSAKVVDISIDVIGSDPFGKVSNGEITLRGYVAEMKVSGLRDEERCHWAYLLREDGCKIDGETAYILFDTLEDFHEAEPGMQVTCLETMRALDVEVRGTREVTALILKPIEYEGNTTRYRRIGISRSLQVNDFEDSKEMDIRII